MGLEIFDCAGFKVVKVIEMKNMDEEVRWMINLRRIYFKYC